MEVWKEINGADGYFVSSKGRVKHVKKSGEKILKPAVFGVDYLGLYLGRGRHKKVHRLVAEAFIPNPDGLPEVNHKDGNKSNNAVENLEWVSHSKNVLHSFEIGRQPSPGSKTPVTYFGKNITITFESQTSCAKFLERNRSAVAWAVTRGTKCAGGRIEYA